MALLKSFGVLALVGFPGEIKIHPGLLIMGSRTVSGSGVGGTKEIRDMIEFCVANEIHPNIEVVPIQYANEALDRVIKKDVKYRFVIDIENSLN
uniref:Alcohol dehydrogenase-like C-terminal domain-containing protein n=2 Tax=Lotus japonicus TaxID=34305 RepID=I3SWA2_LOTJA|nr:unknown [Lotus japonicus]